ncbi:NAD(P)-dependent oxidoreductase [Roseococcus sp. XZZS9]|uniref:L-threonate dehydrogenase n=1 Tax=Roseococcus pinisoli TaxID=2835040 RepID=A0ABS5QCU5_9PROT|nr:L-threonate dehydrogenase [Roseococcus pinisoli]MBS7811329.1 NAD(P)-dependent oxidoreductase [Roseococcus pinisoli]
MKCAVIGLGSMGGGAAASALRAGLDVTGVDPSEAARGAFGNRAVARGADLEEGQAAVLVLTVNAAQARAALFGESGAAQRLAPGGVVVCSATMAPAEARLLAAEAAERGLLYLDAPVSGGAVAAREGRMTVMASGSDAAFAAARPLLDAVAGKVWSLGAEPGQGAAMKVVHQLLAGVHIAAAAEAMALALRAGLDPHTVYDVVNGAAGASWMFKNRMAHVLAGDDTPLSAGDIFVKDLGLVETMAREASLPVPLAAQALQLFVAQRAIGQGGRDDAFVLRVWQAIAGFALPGEEGGAAPRTDPQA